MGNLDSFQKKYPTRAAKEKALRGMNDTQIDALIKECNTPQGKVFYSSFKSTKQGKKK